MKKDDGESSARAPVVDACAVELNFHLGKRHQKGFELQFRLLQLPGGVGVRHHPDAGVEPGAVLPQQTTSQGYRELPIASAVDPSDRPRVPAALQAFQLVDDGVGRLSWPAAPCWSGVEGSCEV